MTKVSSKDLKNYQDPHNYVKGYFWEQIFMNICGFFRKLKKKSKQFLKNKCQHSPLLPTQLFDASRNKIINFNLFAARNKKIPLFKLTSFLNNP